MFACSLRSGSLKPSSTLPLALALSRAAVVTEAPPHIIGTNSTPDMAETLGSADQL
jgi:hypothetical protein